MSSPVEQARYLLENRTPLAVDCGQVCGHACCRCQGDEPCGMRLFPGEEALLRETEGMTLLPAEGGTLLVCGGRCRRSERPLACRLFPLFPYLDAATGRIRAVYDPRAYRVCPLVREHRRCPWSGFWCGRSARWAVCWPKRRRAAGSFWRKRLR